MHQSSAGKLGTLHIDGRQVGGFLDWEIEVTTYPVSKGKTRASKLAQWKAVARKFWMLEKINTDCLEAIFYCFNGQDLIPVSQNQVKLNLPSGYNLEEVIIKPLVMYG